MAILYKPLTAAEAEEGIKSVKPINNELNKRFPDKKNINLVVWASDMHLHPRDGYPFDFGGIYQYIDCTRQYSLCLNEIKALSIKPDSIVLGGDITEMGMKEEWMEFASIMEQHPFDVPTIPVFGNHEHLYMPPKNQMQKVWQEIRQPGWPDLENPDEFFYSTVVKGIKYIVIDTVKQDNGVMSARQKEFLASELKNSNNKILIFQHAHIMNAGNWTDGSLYQDKDMINMINNSPNVLGIFSGHTHKPSLWKYRNKLFGTFPSVAYSIGTGTGWGGIIVDDNDIKGVFYKELYGESYDDCTGGCYQEGKYVFMEPKNFERDPLLNPFFWDRDPDPSKR